MTKQKKKNLIFSQKFSKHIFKNKTNFELKHSSKSKDHDL